MNDFLGLLGVLVTVVAVGGLLILLFDVITNAIRKHEGLKSLNKRDRIIVVALALIVALKIVF
jgi:hypothetical protein